MRTPEWVKPGAWGVAGGAVAAIAIGFMWGGWVTGGTAEKTAAAREKAAVVQAFVPLCVAKAELEPDQLVLLKEESSWQRDDFIVKAGWVANVTEQYRNAVAETCAQTVVKAMEAAVPAKSG